MKSSTDLENLILQVHNDMSDTRVLKPEVQGENKIDLTTEYRTDNSAIYRQRLPKFDMEVYNDSPSKKKYKKLELSRQSKMALDAAFTISTEKFSSRHPL